MYVKVTIDARSLEADSGMVQILANYGQIIAQNLHIGLFEEVFQANWIKVHGAAYRPGLSVVFDVDSENCLPVFGYILSAFVIEVADQWFLDENFALAPKNFLQLYIIHVPVGEVSVLASASFLQHKTGDTYNGTILEKCEATFEYMPSPRIDVIDFEAAASTVLRNTLPDTQIRGCSYHLTHSTWRKIQNLGLSSMYKENENFRHCCGMLDGLAFLAVPDVALPEAAELIGYFDTTYVSGPFRNVRAPNGVIRLRRVEPQFGIEMWNVHEATINGDLRTNNICEAWNNSSQISWDTRTPPSGRLSKDYGIRSRQYEPSLHRMLSGTEDENVYVVKLRNFSAASKICVETLMMAARTCSSFCVELDIVFVLGLPMRGFDILVKP
ncbi:hypothetical protein GQR58_024745 [Nymphon striatum]|nr:hypothetical protein GQR58_024745 [Nymphon striatum]